MYPQLGDIELFAFDYAPDNNWLTCEGQALSIGAFQELFSVIGYKFGGRGAAFLLPDLRKALPMQGMGMRYCIAVHGVYPSKN